MKKLPFPKSVRRITAYLLPDGIGFQCEVRLGSGTVPACAVFRTKRNMLGKEGNEIPWFFDCESNGYGVYLDVQELRHITRVAYYPENYLEEAPITKLTGSRGESLHVYFQKGYTMEGIQFSTNIHFGQLSKACDAPVSGCNKFLERRREPTLFDVSESDLA